MTVLVPAMTRLLKIDQASPSVKRTRKLPNCGSEGYQAGGELKISSGRFSETENIQ